jgi:hypothetical protein
MSNSKYLVPPGVVITYEKLPSTPDCVVKARAKKCLALLPYVCAVFGSENVTIIPNRGKIKVELPPKSGFTFLSIVDYDKHRVIMACVKETYTGEPYGIAELADTPFECSSFEEMVEHMLKHITSVKLGTADLITELQD